MFPLPCFSDIGYESLINLMLKDLFKLLVSCVSEPAETISRVGCSCIRSEVTKLHLQMHLPVDHDLKQRCQNQTPSGAYISHIDIIADQHWCILNKSFPSVSLCTCEFLFESITYISIYLSIYLSGIIINLFMQNQTRFAYI